MKINNDKYSVSKSTLTIVIGMILFKLTLDFIYPNIISEIFGYSGFIKNINLYKYILSWIIMITFFPIILKLFKQICFSSIIIIGLVYLSFIPFLTMVVFYPFPNKYIFNMIIYWSVMLYVYVLFPNFKIKRIRDQKILNMLITFIIIIFSITIIYISAKYTGFRITIDIFNVYDLREEALSFQLPTILSYIYSASKAVNPLLIVYFLHIKQRKKAIFIFLLQILSFSINGSKTVLFSTFLSILIYLIYNKKYIQKIGIYITILNIVGIIEYYWNETFGIINFIVRRVVFIPNLLNYYYYDFFSVNYPDYFKQSFFRHFGVESQYPEIKYMIGNIYFNKPDMAANNGLFSDAYSNLGIWGIIIMPIIFIFALKLLDSCAKGLEVKIFVIVAINMSFIFVSSFFFVTLFTHGIIAVALILYFLPRK